MKLSVIVATRNRAHAIRACLDTPLDADIGILGKRGCSKATANNKNVADIQ